MILLQKPLMGPFVVALLLVVGASLLLVVFQSASLPH
jgi:hypothetical protein